MDNIAIWWWLVPILLLPVFFTMGWIAARIDMRFVLKQAKSIPDGFYKALDALVLKKNNIAAKELAEVLELQNDAKQNTYNLHLTLGRLYRQRGENNKAITLHQELLTSPDVIQNLKDQVLLELGQDFQSAGLIDRAEKIFLSLDDSDVATSAREFLLKIYQQDRDWVKAISLAQELSHEEQKYQFEIAQYYCELAQAELHRSDFNKSSLYANQALNTNKKCTRANIILGDICIKENKPKEAINYYSSIEKQNYEYLSMVGERIYDAYDHLGKPSDGLSVLLGYINTFPLLDLSGVIYDKSLLLHGENQAAITITDIIRRQPNLNGAYRLLGINLPNLDPTWRENTDIIRSVLGQQIQKSFMFRCRHCYFKSQIYFWHCPACNNWETFSPNRVEI